MSVRDDLIRELREHALVIGEVTLTSGRKSSYIIDAKRAILRPAGFRALAQLTAAEARERGARAVGGMTMGADPIACAALAGGAEVDAFFVRKERKGHGLGRAIEGPELPAGTPCLIVEDVVTTGGAAVEAVAALREAGLRVSTAVCVVDREEGGADELARHAVRLRPLFRASDLLEIPANPHG